MDIQTMVDRASEESAARMNNERQELQAARTAVATEIGDNGALVREVLEGLSSRGLVRDVTVDEYPYTADRRWSGTPEGHVTGPRHLFEYSPAKGHVKRRAIVFLAEGARISTYEAGASGSGTQVRTYALTEKGIELFIRSELFGLRA